MLTRFLAVGARSWGQEAEATEHAEHVVDGVGFRRLRHISERFADVAQAEGLDPQAD
eukprot:SAG22_NODE_165_length_16780_cov_57.761525_9_plen_57_part_00